MKRFSLVVLASLIALGLVADAFAQGGGRPINTSGSDAQPLSATVSGGAVLHYVAQSRAVASTDSGAVDSTDDWWHGLVTLNLDMEFANNIKSRVSLQSAKTGAAYARWGTGGDGDDFDIEEAYVTTKDWLAQNLSLKIGQQGYARELKAGEGSMFLDLNNAGPLGEGTALDAGAAGHLGTNDPVGIVATVTGQQWSLDIAWLKVIEGGAGANTDEVVIGAGFTYDLQQGRKLNLDLWNYHNGGTIDDDADIIDFGGGLWWGNAVQNLDIYAEVHAQSGDVNADDGQSALAYRLGGVYHIQGNGNPWVGVAYWSISGDEDNDGGAGEDNEAYLSYENNNDFAIVESNLYGFDLASNYVAIKVMAGVDTTWNVSKTGAMKDNLHITGKLGMFNEEDGDDDLGTSASDDGIGTEFDFVMAWDQSASLSIDFTLAFLSGSDLMEGVTAGLTTDEDDSGIVLVLGTTLKH